ncbi:MAG: histone deacetylase [Deltaproteobacteria bacterium]|nr:histone deacetylase [Deltaproteobacteria bacterium]
MGRTGIVKDNRYLNHAADSYHPESPERLQAVYKMLEEPDMQDKFVEIQPRVATDEELELIHGRRYIQLVASTANRDYTMLDPDTYANRESYETAKLAAGGTLSAVDKVLNGELNNAFAFIRPPGHHAESNRAMGFCLFNNVAIAAGYSTKSYSLKKVLIIDWDLHHGNGTQHSFYERPDVLYFSAHQFPYYPGTGYVTEVGSGAGKGFTVNVPLQAGPGDAEYMQVFEEVLEPIALEFKPEIIFVSAGFDIYYQDPLGGMQVTPAGFANLAKVVLDFAKETCKGKVVFVLEGGYHLNGLRDSIKEVLKAMRGDILSPGRDDKIREKVDRQLIDPVIRKVKEAQKPFWKNI